MKLVSTAALVALSAVLAGCEAKQEENIQAAAENQMEALADEAQEIAADAENGVSDAANTLENQAAALRDEVTTGENEAADDGAANGSANNQ